MSKKAKEPRYYEIEIMRVLEVTQTCFREVLATSFDEALEKAIHPAAPEPFLWRTTDERVAVEPSPLSGGDPYWREDAEAEAKEPQ